MTSFVTGASPTRRDVAAVLKSTAGRLRGRERSPDRRRKPWRNSFDVNDPRAQVFESPGRQTPAEALAWIDDRVRLAREYDELHKERGRRAPLGAVYIRVLEVTLRFGLQFKTGLCDPALAKIAAKANVSVRTVLRALKRLKAHKLIDWCRRTEKTRREGEWAPQIEQVSNAYFFDPRQLPTNVFERWKQFRETRRRRQATEAALERKEAADDARHAALQALGGVRTPAEPPAPTTTTQALLARMARNIEPSAMDE